MGLEAVVAHEAGEAHCRQLTKGLVATQGGPTLEQYASRRFKWHGDLRHSGQHRGDHRKSRGSRGTGWGEGARAERQRDRGKMDRTCSLGGAGRMGGARMTPVSCLVAAQSDVALGLDRQC